MAAAVTADKSRRLMCLRELLQCWAHSASSAANSGSVTSVCEAAMLQGLPDSGWQHTAPYTLHHGMRHSAGLCLGVLGHIASHRSL